MIKIENTEVMGWEHAIRGMRNPLESWARIDSYQPPCLCCQRDSDDEAREEHDITVLPYVLGENDHDLMMRLAKAGPEHAKYRRMIVVYADVTAPLYWWKEYDTYKVGTVANSCSTMHKITDKVFTLEDFSCEHLENSWFVNLKETIRLLNEARAAYHWCNTDAKKEWWWQLIQLLPSSYNQRRTLMLNYEVLANIYKQRKNHKLDEWRQFCSWASSLPYSELITGKETEENG